MLPLIPSMNPERCFSCFMSVCVWPRHLSVASANSDEVKQVQTCKSLKNNWRGRKQQSSLKRHHGSLNLLVGHKHHNVPGPQTKIRRHESAKIKKYVKIIGHMMKNGSGFVPFIERRGSLVNQHAESAVQGPSVLPRLWIHVAGFHHIHGWRHQGGAESCRESCREVTRHVVC